MWFTSDNAGPAAPQVIQAIAKANAGYASSYGNDAIMERVTAKIRDLFEAPEAAVFLVATGTAANALGLSLLCPPWATIYCHRSAHISVDECAAPEFFTGGAKLTLIDGDSAKIDANLLAESVQLTGSNGVHGVQRGALSLTNTTECGTIYTPPEIAELSKIADVPVHMDGARFANALVTLGCTAAEATWKCGVDVMSFGGTKNGLMGVEAVILFDPTKAWEFELRRKRAAHLFSKHRYLSAQMDAYLTDDLWLDLAAKANNAAAKLSTAIRKIPGASLNHETQANMVFAQWPRSGHKKAQDLGARYYLWPENQTLTGPDSEPVSARLVCNWSTTDAEIDTFVAALQA